MFYEISASSPDKTSVFFTDALIHPVIKHESNVVGVPLPRTNNDHVFFEGHIFPKYGSSYKIIWQLYLATLAHVAGHIKVTDYALYQKWLEGKNKSRARNVIEYIENMRVNEFLKKTHQEYYEVITAVVDATNKTVHHKTKSRDLAVRKFVNAFGTRSSIDLSEIDEQIRSDSNLVEIAEKLYRSQSTIIDHKYPFTENQTSPKFTKPIAGLPLNLYVPITGMIESLNEMWCVESSLKQKMEQLYKELAKDLHFDKIYFVPERYSEYLLIERQIGPIAKQMSAQIKSIPNAIDDAVSEDMGFLEMQKAIQAIASQNSSIQIFEQDHKKRIMEEWAIVVDTSSSMKVKFRDMKKLILCFAQAAHDLISKNGRWGMFCFNNDFSIVKAGNERYSEIIKARIGGIDMKGLSYLPDAITLSRRILSQSNTEKKYIFVITDGLSLGYDKIDKSLEDSISQASRENINLVGIGVPQYKPTFFTLSIPYDSMRKMVSRFISTYMQIATSSL
jgi:hypothetical protein